MIYAGRVIISLKEAIKLTKVQDDELCYIRKESASKNDVIALTVDKIKIKYNMKNTMMVGIQPKNFNYYCAIEFEIR